jgi:hypothetical protein
MVANEMHQGFNSNASIPGGLDQFACPAWPGSSKLMTLEHAEAVK